MENSSDNKDPEVEKSFTMEQFDMVKTVGTVQELIMNCDNNSLCRHICKCLSVYILLFAGTFARI